MSTAFASGTVALMLGANAQLTPYAAKLLLEQTAHDVGPAGWDNQTGYGTIDAQNATLAAASWRA
jgi:subtilisin family serine protease